MSENEVHTPSCCEAVRENFSAFLDAELDIEDRTVVEKHLHECSDCLRELHGYKQVNDLYTTLSTVNAPEDFEKKVMAALKPRVLPFRNLYQHWKLVATSAALFLFVISLGLTWVQWKSEYRLISSRDHMAREIPAPDALSTPMASPPVADFVSTQESIAQMPAEKVNDRGDHTPAMGFMTMGAPELSDSGEFIDDYELEQQESFYQTGETMLSQPIGIETITDNDDAAALGGSFSISVPHRQETGGFGGGIGSTEKMNDLSEEGTMGGYGGYGGMEDVARDTDQPVVQESNVTREAKRTRRTLANRVLHLENDRWIEQRDVVPETYNEINFGDDIHVKLLQSDAGLAELARLNGEVLFYHDGEWYLLRLPPDQIVPSSE